MKDQEKEATEFIIRRRNAMAWWRPLTILEKTEWAERYYPGRHPYYLSGREVQIIYENKHVGA